MREIKFRVWWVDDKEMDECTRIDLPNKTHHDEVITMQYTGLKDKNGKEIYEGDIVSANFGNSGIVTFNADNYAGLPAFHICDKNGNSVDYYYGAVADSSCEVTGNIYENPGLLNE